MKTSAHTGDIPLASFITDTTLSTPASLTLRLKKNLFPYSPYAGHREEFVLHDLSVCEKENARAAGSGGGSSQAEVQFDRKHIGDFLSPPLPFPITINPLTHDNH